MYVRMYIYVYIYSCLFRDLLSLLRVRQTAWSTVVHLLRAYEPFCPVRFFVLRSPKATSVCCLSFVYRIPYCPPPLLKCVVINLWCRLQSFVRVLSSPRPSATRNVPSVCWSWSKEAERRSLRSTTCRYGKRRESVLLAGKCEPICRATRCRNRLNVFVVDACTTSRICKTLINECGGSASPRSPLHPCA